MGLWAAMLLASKYRWTDPSGVVRLRPDAPLVVLLEARSLQAHCTRTDIRIALSSATRSMLGGLAFERWSKEFSWRKGFMAEIGGCCLEWPSHAEYRWLIKGNWKARVRESYFKWQSTRGWTSRRAPGASPPACRWPKSRT